MKTKKIILLVCLTLPFLFSCMSMSMESFGTSFSSGKPMPDAEKMIENQDVIEIDTIAFETNDFLAIRQKLGAEFAKYQRIPNPNYKVYSAKVFTTGGKELYTIVPDVNQFGIQVHLKNTSGQKGKVEITAKTKMGFASVSLEYIIKSDFFAQPYTFALSSKTDVTAGFSPEMKTNSQYVLYYENKPVLAYVSFFDLSNPENNRTNIVADHDFLTGHEQELAAWCVIFILIQDVNQQLAEDAPPASVNNPGNPPQGPSFNNDGSFDNNKNPFDKF
jgi:hypothetical protein